MISTLAKRYLPKPVYRVLVAMQTHASVAIEFAVDYFNYAKHAGPRDGAAGSRLRGRRLEAQVIKDYHRVEKGLSLHSPKQPFGADVAKRLDALIPVASRSSADLPWLQHATEARDALRLWNEQGEIEELVAPVVDSSTATASFAAHLEAFFSSRRSVRDFDPGERVDETDLRRAVALAMSTPSVCNRQAARVRFYSQAADVAAILSHQNGNAGFRHQVPVVAIVSVERGLFSAAGERNQMWIDGGLFSMSLVWALHGLGLSTCMLNWSMTNGESRRLRRRAGVPASEDIIMMVAIGHAREGARVARSPKRPIEEVASFL